MWRGTEARGVALSLVLAVAACGGDDEPATPATFEEACGAIDGCATPVRAVSGPIEAIWRVLVERDASGALSVAAIQEVDVPAAIGPPQGPLDGDHALASLDPAGMPLEVAPLRFPETLLVEGRDPLMHREEVALEGPSSTVAYVRVDAMADSLAVVQPDGTVLSSIPAPAPGEARMTASDASGRASEPLLQPSVSSACAHVILLEGPSDALWYPGSLDTSYPLTDRVTPTQRAVVQAALGRLSPMHCAGVGRVAFVRFPEAPRAGGMVTSWIGGNTGDVVLINSALDFEGESFGEESLQLPKMRALLTHTVIHEAAHSTTYMLNYAAGIPQFSGAWAPTMRDLALETIDNVRLRSGFSREWARMHQSFIDLGWSEPYIEDPIGSTDKDELEAKSPAQLAAAGFMSTYGGANPYEDIAETATWPLTGAVFRDAGVAVGPFPSTNDYACIAMQRHGEMNVPASLASVYSKVSFLRGLGMLPDDAFDHCIGESTGLPYDHEGIAIYEEGTLLREYGTPEATIGTLDGRYVFSLYASGSAEFMEMDYAASLELRIDLGPSDAEHPVENVSWPRGVYTLAPLHPNHFELRVPDAPAADFDVIDGFVLVAEASHDRIVGSVFVREAWRPHAPIPVPQSFDPPLQFRFLMTR